MGGGRSLTLIEWVEEVYKYATGWLGWSHTEAMETPLQAILLALDGKVDFLKKTNPLGSADEPTQQSAEDMKRVLRAARPNG